MQYICKVSEVASGQSKHFSYNGQPAILVNVGGMYHAYVNVCTHKGGTCDLIGEELVCCLHAAVFDAATGRATEPPAPSGSALTPIALVTRDGMLYAEGGDDTLRELGAI